MYTKLQNCEFGHQVARVPGARLRLGKRLICAYLLRFGFVGSGSSVNSMYMELSYYAVQGISYCTFRFVPFSCHTMMKWLHCLISVRPTTIRASPSTPPVPCPFLSRCHSCTAFFSQARSAVRYVHRYNKPSVLWLQQPLPGKYSE